MVARTSFLSGGLRDPEHQALLGLIGHSSRRVPTSKGDRATRRISGDFLDLFGGVSGESPPGRRAAQSLGHRG
jgi:hypothetical protein